MTAQPLLEYQDPDFLELNPHLANTGIGTIGRKIDPHTSTGVQLIKELITNYTSQPFTPGRPPYLNAIVLASDVLDEPESPSLEEQKKIVAVCRIPGFDCVPPPSKLASQSNGADATTGQTPDFGFIYNNQGIKRQTDADWNEIFSHTLYFQRGNLSDGEYSRIVPGSIVKVTFADFEYKTRPEIIGINNLTGYTLPLATLGASAMAMAPSEPYEAPTPIQIPISPLQTTEAYDYPIAVPRSYSTDSKWSPGYCSWANPMAIGLLDSIHAKEDVEVDFTPPGWSKKIKRKKQHHGMDVADVKRRAGPYSGNTKKARDGYDIIVLHDGGKGGWTSSEEQPAAPVRVCSMWFKENVTASSHYYITFDGTLYVLSDESMVCNHVVGGYGVGSWGVWQRVLKKGQMKVARQKGPNFRSIAIDFQNGWSQGHKGFGLGKTQKNPPYTKAQIETCILLMKDISARRGIPIDDNHVLAHFELQKSSKNDPLPFFPWEMLMEAFPGITYDHRKENWNHPANVPPPKNSWKRQGATTRTNPNWQKIGEETDKADRLKSFNPHCQSVLEGWRQYDEKKNRFKIDPEETAPFVESSPPPAPPRFGKSVDM